MVTNSIENYLDQLKLALAGSDKAMIQDALADAEDHLQTALENIDAPAKGISADQALARIIAEYGAPEEIAEAYREVEALTRPVLGAQKPAKPSSRLGRFFGIFTDPRAWGALVYLLISLLTGALYFCWAFIGVSSALIFAVFIFGLPLAAFFVISFRGLALMEGRIVEALLGVRMPRRTVFSLAHLNWRARLMAQLKDKQTWKILGYLLLQGVLGYLYFAIFILLIATALLFAGLPIISSLGLPVAVINDVQYFAPVAAFPFTLGLGVIIATITMYFARWLGGWHGKYAKMMLVGD